MEKSVKDGKPFFVWRNPSRMHIYTHLRDEHKKLAAPYTSELDLYSSGMMEQDQRSQCREQRDSKSQSRSRVEK